MKTFFYLTALFMCIALCFTGCSDDDNSTDPNGGEVFIRADISGDFSMDYEAELINFLNSEGIEIITGYTEDNQNSDFLQLQLDNIPQGAQNLELEGAGGTHQASFVKFSASMPQSYTAYEGNIEITVNNESRIEGTFHFKAKNKELEIEAVNGEFAVNKE